MSFNALPQRILEYCCTVWGNCSVESLQRLLKVHKRCARWILDATISDSSVDLFNKLVWLPIDDIIRVRKLYIFFNPFANTFKSNVRFKRFNTDEAWDPPSFRNKIDFVLRLSGSLLADLAHLVNFCFVHSLCLKKCVSFVWCLENNYSKILSIASSSPVKIFALWWRLETHDIFG